MVENEIEKCRVYRIITCSKNCPNFVTHAKGTKYKDGVAWCSDGQFKIETHSNEWFDSFPEKCPLEIYVNAKETARWKAKFEHVKQYALAWQNKCEQLEKTSSWKENDIPSEGTDK